MAVFYPWYIPMPSLPARIALGRGGGKRYASPIGMYIVMYVACGMIPMPSFRLPLLQVQPFKCWTQLGICVGELPLHPPVSQGAWKLRRIERALEFRPMPISPIYLRSIHKEHEPHLSVICRRQHASSSVFHSGPAAVPRRAHPHTGSARQQHCPAPSTEAILRTTPSVSPSTENAGR